MTSTGTQTGTQAHTCAHTYTYTERMLNLVPSPHIDPKNIKFGAQATVENAKGDQLPGI